MEYPDDFNAYLENFLTEVSSKEKLSKE